MASTTNLLVLADEGISPNQEEKLPSSTKLVGVSVP
jgi:hypothetical protein